jgi:hypothetical protein
MEAACCQTTTCRALSNATSHVANTTLKSDTKIHVSRVQEIGASSLPASELHGEVTGLLVTRADDT